MAANVNTRVLDLGLNVLDTEPDKIVICSAEPTSYTEANSTYCLGAKTFAGGGACGSPAAGTPNGRKVSTTAITDGVVSANGNAGYWAVLDTVNSRLLATGPVSAAQVVTLGNAFSLASFDIRLPNQA